MANRPVGKASVKIEVEGAEEAKRDVREVRGEIDETSRSIGETVEAADEAINTFRMWAGVLAAGAVAAGGLVKTVATLAGGMGSLQKAANEAGEAIRTATDSAQLEGAAENFRKLAQENANFLQRSSLLANDAIEGTGSLVDGAAQSIGNLVNLLSDFGREQAELFEQTAEGLRDQAQERARVLLQQEQSRREEGLQNELIKARVGQLEGVARVEAEYAEQRRLRNEQIAEAESNARLDELDLLRQLEQEDQRIAEKRIRAIRDQEAAALESARKRREEEAKTAAQAAEDKAALEVAEELRNLRRELEAQARQANENTKELRRLNQQVVNFSPDIRKVAQSSARRSRA